MSLVRPILGNRTCREGTNGGHQGYLGLNPERRTLGYAPEAHGPAACQSDTLILLAAANFGTLFLCPIGSIICYAASWHVD
jgi:hypothetical protein